MSNSPKYYDIYIFVIPILIISNIYNYIESKSITQTLMYFKDILYL